MTGVSTGAVGLWRLGLAEGNSSESFQIVDTAQNLGRLVLGKEEGGSNDGTILQHKPVLIYSLSGRHITLTLRKQPASDAAGTSQA